jgi:hypothetical protein
MPDKELGDKAKDSHLAVRNEILAKIPDPLFGKEPTLKEVVKGNPEKGYPAHPELLEDAKYSEWFDFKGNSPLEIVREFMKTMSWVKREVPLSEIAPLKRLSRQLRKQHAKNTNFLRSITKRNDILNQIQEPVIQAIQQFILNLLLFAGFVIAPCGSGKTLMTCRGIKGLKKVIKKHAEKSLREVDITFLNGSTIAIDSSILLYKYRYIYSSDDFHIKGFNLLITEFIFLIRID